MNKIKYAFEKAKQEGFGCLIGYITSGDPKPELTPKIADALIAGGVDILELGLPFSDPIADGPTIQNASLRSLKAGTTPKRVLEIAQTIKNKHEVPLLIMSYYNPIFQYGLNRFLGEAKTAGIDGFIIPDLPVEEADDYRKAARNNDLDTIFLVSPATSHERLARIVDASSGFLYLVSRFGVTGAQTRIADSTLDLIRKVKPLTAGKVPLAVGFGLSEPKHVKAVIGAGAEAAIVGSAFIKIIEKNQDSMLPKLEATAAALKCATTIRILKK
jgi:tryptophan synthase alpha chain